MPSQSTRSYSKNVNSYNYWVSQIAKQKAVEKKHREPARERDSEKPKIRTPITVEEPVIVTHVTLRKPRKPKVAPPSIPAPVTVRTPSQSTSTGGIGSTIEARMQQNLDDAKKRFGQFAPYAQHSGHVWQPVGTEPSSSDPEHPHSISVNQYGELGCNCRGYIYHNGPEGKTCTHCKQFAAANN